MNYKNCNELIWKMISHGLHRFSRITLNLHAAFGIDH